MDGYEIVDMEVQHIDDVVRIEEMSFKTPWTKNDFISEFVNNKCAKYRIVVKDKKIVAYGGMWILLDEAHITNIAVHPEFRGIGVGNALMEDLIETAKNNGVANMTLEVRTGNTAAQNLYKKFGFVDVAVRRKYYADTGEDGIIMWKYNI